MVKRDNSSPNNSEQVCSSAWVGYCSQSTTTPHFFFAFQTWYYTIGGLVSLLIEKDKKFCLQGMIILGSVGELIIKIMKLHFIFFFINILVIISFCLSQCRKRNGRPSFNHMQRNSYLKIGQIQGYKYALLFGHSNCSMNNFQIIYPISHYQPL